MKRYAHTGDGRSMQHLILFILDDGRGSEYLERIPKYFIHLSVTAFLAQTAEQFRGITKDPAVHWNAMLLDSAAADANYDVLRRFAEMNPGIVIGVEYRGGVAGNPILPNAVRLEEPSNIDEWLRNMYQLLNP